MLFLGQDKGEDKAMENRAKSIKSPSPPPSWLEPAGIKRGRSEGKRIANSEVGNSQWGNFP